MLRTCFIALTLVSFALAQTDPVCTGVYDNVGGKCLFIDPFTNANYEEARYFCQNFGGDLVSISSFALYKDIVNHIKGNGFVTRDFWIGGSDLIDGVWFWIDGTRVPSGTPYWAVYGFSSNNYAQEPVNGGIENFDCLQLDHTRFMYYDDDDCLKPKALICEDLRASRFVIPA